MVSRGVHRYCALVQPRSGTARLVTTIVIGFFGGVWNDQGVMTITNSTIANNSDEVRGGCTVNFNREWNSQYHQQYNFR